MEIITNTVPASPEEAQALEAQGWMKCQNPRCTSYLDPQEIEQAWQDNAYTCPHCNETWYPRSVAPFEQSLKDQERLPGRGRDYETMVGLTKTKMGQIGEQVVRDMDVLGKYGKIVWWTPYHSSLDGGTDKGWGLEVKAANALSEDPRFFPGTKAEIEGKIRHALELRYSNILGILPLLNFQESVADIYVMEMGLEEFEYKDARGHTRRGVGLVSFRPQSGARLFAEVPFNNPFLAPGQQQQISDIPF